MKFVQLKSLKDIVMLVASSPATNVVQYLKNDDDHMYFVIGGTLSEVFLYFIKLNEKIEGDFITYNPYTGEIGFSDKFISEPNLNSFPIINIAKQDLITEDVLEKVSQL